MTPPLHPVLFPNMPTSEDNGLWSSTPTIRAATSNSPGVTYAWWVDLAFGGIDYKEATQTNFVLFVKDP